MQLFSYRLHPPFMLTSLLNPAVAALQDVPMAPVLQLATRCSLAQPYHPPIIQGGKKGEGGLNNLINSLDIRPERGVAYQLIGEPIVD